MTHYRSLLTALLLLASAAGSTLAQKRTAPAIEDVEIGKTRNVHACGKALLAGQPSKDDIPAIKRRGIERVISLRANSEIDWDEGAAVKDAGLEYVAIPISGPDSLSDEVFGRIRKLLAATGKTPTLLHCGSANRVGAVWLTHRVLDQGVGLELARKEAKTIGLQSAALEEKALSYIKRQNTEPSIRPGINANFLKTDLNVREWLGRFEVESREVFAARREVVKAIGIRPGARVADIGAGTGFFTRLFADAVGPDGWVFAVDISPRFVEHISQRAREENVPNITTVLCSDNSVGLPPASIDVAFICDTYHHFEYPQTTLSTLHRALRPGGTLVVIDFERIPGKSREFIVNHVRAGKKVFRGEIQAAGFEFVEEKQIKGFKENYFLILKKK